MDVLPGNGTVAVHLGLVLCLVLGLVLCLVLGLVLCLVLVLGVGLVHVGPRDGRPPHRPGAPPERRAVLRIHLDAGGQATLDGVTLSRAALRSALLSRHRADPNAEAVLSADPDVEFAQATGMIDLLRAAGIWRFAITVDPARDPNRWSSRLRHL